MHDVPGQLTVAELAELFGGRTRFVERLAEYPEPLPRARDVLSELPEAEQVEALNAHPPIGARGLEGRSVAEQGSDEDVDVLRRLSDLNQMYEEKFGFRFLVFVNRRPRREIIPILEARLERTRNEELVTGLDELVAIAYDRATAG